MKTIEKNNNFHDAQERAENIIFKTYQSKEHDFIRKFQGNIFYKEIENEIVVLKGRKTIDGKQTMKLVPPKTMLYNKLTSSYHRKYHMSPAFIATQMIPKYYCPGLMKRLKKLQRICPLCRKRAKKVNPPEMGMLGNKRLIPNAPFRNVQMDLSGPHLVKEFVNKRAATRKIWILVAICDYTRLVSFSIVESLSKDHLLCTLQAHFARYGKSTRIETDLGTNFTASAKHLNGKEDTDKMDEGESKQLQLELQSLGCTIVQRCPSAPHIQGSAEHTVKLLKTALKSYKSAFTPFQWIYNLENAQHTVNSRPIGLSSTGDVLTPSDINPVHTGVKEIEIEENQDVLPVYLKRMQEHVKLFHQKWIELYKTSVLRQKKWTKPSPQLDVGDTVIILDHFTSTGYPTLGRIIMKSTDSDGYDRYLHIRYKLPSGIMKTVKRTPQKVSLILSEKQGKYGIEYDADDLNDLDEKIKVKVNVQEDIDEIKDII